MMNHAPKGNLRTRLSKLMDRSSASTNDHNNSTTDKYPVDEKKTESAVERTSQQDSNNDLLDRNKSTVDRVQKQQQQQQGQISPLVSPQQQQGHKSFFPSMRLRTFSQDRPNLNQNASANSSIHTAKGASICSNSSCSNTSHNTHNTTAAQAAEKSSSLLLLPTTEDQTTDITSLPNFITPEPRSVVASGIEPVRRHNMWNDPTGFESNQQSHLLSSSPARTSTGLPPYSSPSKFDIFMQRAESKLAQREEMIVDLTNQTAQQEEEIQALQQDIIRLQKLLIQEQETVLHDGINTTSNTYGTTNTSTAKHTEQQQPQPLHGEEEHTSIANLLHKAFHDFQVLLEEKNDFVPLDASYVRRLCYQVYEFTTTKKRMEKQLFFVKGMCDQIVDSLRDHLASIEQKQTQVEHTRLNELSSKSYQQSLERQQLSERLSIVLEEIQKYANELEQESYTNKALREALTMVETDRANYEISMLNELSNLHEEKEEISAEHEHQLLIKNALATHLQETLERTRFNYRASGLFGQSSREDDPNAIVLLLDTSLQAGGHQDGSSGVDTLTKGNTMEATEGTAVLWGLPRSSVSQAFRHGPTLAHNLGNSPTKDCDHYCTKSTDDSSDYNSDLQHRQTYSMTTPSQKDKILNRTYHQTKKALNVLYLLESLVVGNNEPIIARDLSPQKYSFAFDVASNVNQTMIKKMIRKLERITNRNTSSKESKCHFSKGSFIVTARDIILSMLILPEQDEEYKFMIEAILFAKVFSIE